MKFVCVLHMIWRVWNRKILRKARKHEPQPHIDYNVVFTVTAGCRIYVYHYKRSPTSLLRSGLYP